MKYMLGFLIKAGSALICFICLSSMAEVNEPGGQVYMSVDQGVNWEKAGVGLPADVSINALVLKDKLVIAGTNSHGIYISDDRAKSWYPSSRGLPKNARITALVSHKHFLFAGTPLNGVYFSNDDGETWQPANTGLTNSQRNLLKVSATSGAMLYPTIRSFYSSGTSLFVGTNNGIYRTLNDGTSWNAEKIGIQVNSFTASGQTLYVATNKGVFNSGDFGKTWDWIYKDGAIYKMSADKKEIYLLDFNGNVYQSTASNFGWIKTDIYLPFQYTFRLTPSSRKLFNVDWKHSFKNLGSFDQTIRFNGLPENSSFTEFLNTPFGVLAAKGSQNGC